MATTLEPTPGTTSEQTGSPTKAKGWGTDAADQPLRPMEFERRALRPDDVAIKITYAGICHSDLHTARNDWHGTIYPKIPGHEIVGTVTAVGSDVTAHKVGDTVAVGCMVDSCMACDQCLEGWEVFCRERCTQTYNSPDRHAARSPRAATPTISWSATISCSRCRTAWTWLRSRRCSAPGSPLTPRSASIRSAPAPRSR